MVSELERQREALAHYARLYIQRRRGGGDTWQAIARDVGVSHPALIKIDDGGKLGDPTAFGLARLLHGGDHSAMIRAALEIYAKQPPAPPPSELPPDLSFSDLRHRVWWAYNATERGHTKKLLSLTTIKDRYGKVAHDLFVLLRDGAKDTLGSADAELLGRMFGVSPAWLLTGEGEPPVLSGPLFQLPRHRHTNTGFGPALKAATTEEGTLDPLRALVKNNFKGPSEVWKDRLTEAAFARVTAFASLAGASGAFSARRLSPTAA